MSLTEPAPMHGECSGEQRPSVGTRADRAQMLQDPGLASPQLRGSTHTVPEKEAGLSARVSQIHGRRLLRRENKDIDSLSSHSKVVNSVVFILCVEHSQFKKKKSPHHPTKSPFAARKHRWAAEEKQLCKFPVSGLPFYFKKKYRFISEHFEICPNI